MLILGATGTLGRALAMECHHRDIVCILSDRAELDLRDPGSIERAIDRHRPWAVANAAGWVRVDQAEDDPEACRAVNATGAMTLAKACARSDVPSLSFSTDLVFDGATDAPYTEQSTPNPLNAYGRSKLEMEEQLAHMQGRHLVIRTAAFFSPYDAHNFAVHCLNALARRTPFAAATDCTVSPTYVPDLCRAAIDLLIDRESGLWHLTNGEAVTWHDFAQRLIQATGTPGTSLAPVSAYDMAWRAPRPEYSALSSVRGQLMPKLDRAIGRFAAIWQTCDAQQLQPI